MKQQLDEALAFLNETAEPKQAEAKNATTQAQPTPASTNGNGVQAYGRDDHSISTAHATKHHWQEKEDALRLILEKWSVEEEAGTPNGKKALADKENVLKSIIYNWKI